MVFQVCPLHAFEEIDGAWISNDVGWQFTCPRVDHVPPGPYTWLSAPPPPLGRSCPASPTSSDSASRSPQS